MGFGEDVGAECGGCVDGVVFGFGFYAGLPGGAVVAEAAAAFGAFGGAIEEDVFAGGFVEGDDVGLAAGFFQFIESPEFFWSGFELGFDRGPFETLVAMKILFEAGFQGGEDLFGLLRGEGFFLWHGVEFSARNWKRENGNWEEGKEGRNAETLRTQRSAEKIKTCSL